MKFIVVGTVGFVVDAGAFSFLINWLNNPYYSRFASFLIAVSATYILNNRFTFIGSQTKRPLRYFIGQSIGIALNMLVFSVVIYKPLWLPWQYYLGLAAGSLAAMCFNYEVSRRYVFI